MGLQYSYFGRFSRFQIWLLRAAAVLGLLLTAACGGGGAAAGKTYPPYRYRLTVEVETPQGLRTGSSVIEVRTAVAGPYSIPNPGQVFTRIKGEAVAIDLRNGQTLFALLRSDWDVGWATNAYLLQVPYPTQQEVKARAADGQWTAAAEFDLWMERALTAHGVFTLPRTCDLDGRQVSAWPMFVRFRDPHDPAGVEQVDPDKLNAALGKGYAIHGITVERTEDAVQGQTSSHLAADFFRTWAAQRELALKDGVIDNPYLQTLTGQLSRNDFISD